MLKNTLIADCCAIKELTTLEGEASANNRKAKLIFFYEWVIKGEWQGVFESKAIQCIFCFHTYSSKANSGS